MPANVKKMRSVSACLFQLEKAGRVKTTIRSIRSALLYFSRFFGVDLAYLHNHITVKNLDRYTDTSGFKALSLKSLCR
jgi:hypothetical protein